MVIGNHFKGLWGRLPCGWRILSAIFRWGAVLASTVLFSFGLVLHLPVKILILLALIPSVAVLAPRKIQKWCWGAIALAALSVWLWVYLPWQDSTDWKTHPFLTESIDNLFENAAPLYQELVEKTQESVFSFPYNEREDQISYGGPWEPQQFPALSRWMDECEPTLQHLMQIARMPLCRFEVPGDPFRFQKQQLRIKVLKAWCSILLRSANRDLEMGAVPSALEKQLAIVRIARHFYQQGTLLDQAAGYYLEEVAGRVLGRNIVEHGTESMLLEIAETLGQTHSQWPNNWPPILRREKLLACNFAAAFYQMNTEGKTRLSRDIGMGLHEVLGYPRYPLFGSEQMVKLAVVAMWLSMPTSPQAVGELIEERFDRYARMAQEGKDLQWIDIQPLWKRGLNCRSIVDWYAKQRVSFYYPLERRDRRQKALHQAMTILIELRRYFLQHGHWPQTLEELTTDPTSPPWLDPVSQTPFVYQCTDDGFRLYSIGENRQNDDGIQNLREGKDDRLYWPTPR